MFFVLYLPLCSTFSSLLSVSFACFDFFWYVCVNVCVNCLLIFGCLLFIACFSRCMSTALSSVLFVVCDSPKSIR